MLKWLFVMIVAAALLGFLAPTLSKLGLWRLPGDLRFKFRGRDVFLPITSTVLVSLVLMLVLRLLRI